LQKSGRKIHTRTEKTLTKNSPFADKKKLILGISTSLKRS